MFTRRAQLFRSSFAPGLGIDTHYRFSSRQPVADPRAVIEHQLQPVGADHLFHLVSAKLLGIKPQLLSELLLHLRRQSEVLPFWKKRTNLVTNGPQLLP